jgi:Flp pilus assembly protein TadD
MTERLIKPTANDTAAIAKVWSDCEKAAPEIPQEKFDKERAALLQKLVCDASEDREAIALGIIRNWVSSGDDKPSALSVKPSALSVQLARGLLGQDGKECAATKDFDEATKEKLRAAAAKAVPTSAPVK